MDTSSAFLRRGGLQSLIALTMLAALAGGGCVTQRAVVEQPDGFALYGEEETYRAVSPEGVVLRLRLVANEPVQTLGFWSEALKVHLQRSGYALLAEELFVAPAGDGVLLEWIAPLAGEDWLYMTAICIADDQIAIAEAAGPYDTYGNHRHSLVQSLATLTIQR